MSFDTLAPHYRWMEWLLAGGKLQRCRTAFLREVKDARNVLLLGEGNGRFLVPFARANRSAQITIVDASAGMLRQTQRRVASLGPQGNPERIEYVHADVLAWSRPERSFDLIVTNFFFDCFRAEQLEALMPRLASSAAANAQWLVSDFRVPQRGFARWRARWIVAVMYGFFRIVTRLPARVLAPVDSLLQSAGFELRERRISEWGLLHTDLWQRSNQTPSHRCG
jgi:hypothetical protein